MRNGNSDTWEFGILMSHHLPSIRCCCDNALSCDSYSANRTKPKPFDCFVLISLLTCKVQIYTKKGYQPKLLLLLFIIIIIKQEHDESDVK